jgi:CRP-like cAMP-binding protein
LPLDGMRGLLARFPDMRERLMLGLAQTVQNLTGATHDLMSKDAQKRLATWLLRHNPKQGEDVAMKERKRELAAQLAITPETLSRLLRQLMSAGLIEVKGYSIKLLDLAALQNLAHG